MDCIACTNLLIQIIAGGQAVAMGLLADSDADNTELSLHSSAQDVGGCARTVPWSPPEDSVQRNPPKLRKSRKKKKGSKRARKPCTDESVEKPKVCVEDSGSICDKALSLSEEVSRACFEDTEIEKPLGSNEHLLEGLSRTCVEDSEKTVEFTSSEEVLKASSETGVSGELLRTCVEHYSKTITIEETLLQESPTASTNSSEELSKTCVEATKASIENPGLPSKKCASEQSQPCKSDEDRESVVSDSCRSYASPKRPVPSEHPSPGSPVIRPQCEQITKEVQEKLLPPGPLSSTDSSGKSWDMSTNCCAYLLIVEDSSSDGEHSEQPNSAPSLSLLMDTSKGTVMHACVMWFVWSTSSRYVGGLSEAKKKKLLTTSMFTPTSGRIQPGRTHQRHYSLLNTASAKATRKRKNLSKAEESMAANITPANISTLLADEDLW